MLRDQIYAVENMMANNRAKLKELDQQIDGLSCHRAALENDQTQLQEILFKLKAEESPTDPRKEILQEKYNEQLNRKLGHSE